MENDMTDSNPTAETAEAKAQAAEVTETVMPETPVEETFDKDRAMQTIHKQREAEKEYKKQLKELDQLKAEKKQREDAALSETERLTKQAKELADRNAKLESDILRRDVIAETGLPASFASRLQGTTKEELLADAQELAKTLPQLKVPPKIAPTNPSGGQIVETDAQLREKLFGGSGKLDAETIKRLGGGVVWKE